MTKAIIRSLFGIIFSVGVMLILTLSAGRGGQGRSEAINIGSRLEMFVDHFLIETMNDVELFIHRPVKMPLAENPITGAYMTVFKDGDIFRAYYREYVKEYEGARSDGNPGEKTSYAESRDGHEWTFPELNIFEINGSKRNNAVLAGMAPCSHNFSPFIDKKPGVEQSERYKALAGTHEGGGLYAFVSSDGIHWIKVQEEPVMTSEDYAFDSQNVSFWSEVEGCYVCYFRSWETPHGKLRTISRSTSQDFIHWSEPKAMNPNLPDEHLYTNQTHPYFRAPHIYIALPTRFSPSRGSSTEILFMTCRGDAPYERLFPEAYIRPGLDPERWGNRANYAALNVVPTGPEEMSIYHAHSGYRYTLRTDGFVSVNAPYDGGEMITKPLLFSGKECVLNLSTSATGSMQVEILNPDYSPIPGYRVADCPPIVGDAIESVVSWKSGTDVGGLSGKPVRLRFIMRDCDLYSVRFR